MYDPIELPAETLDLRDLTWQIAKKYQMPLESRILSGEQLARTDLIPGREAAKDAGLWGLTLPEDVGGADLSMFNLVSITEVAARPLAQLRFGGDNIPAALLTATGRQKQRYADPLLSGAKDFCFAQTEPGGGADPARAIRARAVRDGDEWVINGTKVFISAVEFSDIVFVVVRTDGPGTRPGVSMIAVDLDNPGLTIGRAIEVLGGMTLHELFFDNCRVPDYALLGSEGSGFGQAQKMLSAARMTVGATALGIATRALEMTIDYAKSREAFGGPLADKQVIQGFIADSWMEIHQARLALYNAAKRTDDGHDTRVEAGMVKLLGTETVGRVLDRAIQVHGAAGVAFDNPLSHWYGLQRLARIYEGPTEVHKYRVIARKLLAS